MKFIKRLFIFTLLLGIGAVGFGYYHGLRPHNVNEFMTDILDRFTTTANEEEPSDVIVATDDEIPKPKEKSKKHTKSKKKKKPKVELQPLPRNPFAAIDSHARKATEATEKDISTLANYLSQKAHTDIDKARAIYVWLTDNIVYDDAGYNSERYGDNSALGVLRKRKGVCGGFSNLFQALGEEMGLDIKRVVGYAKGYGYVKGRRFADTDHAWNLIKLKGHWRVFDATWGQGSGTNVKGKLVSKKKFNDYWFNVDPYKSIFTHLPEELDLTYVTPTINLKAFESLANIDDSYFKLGFKAKETYQKVRENRRIKFPKCYGVATYAKVKEAPKYEVLKIGQSYNFELYVPRGLQVAIIDEQENWTYFEGNKGVFKLRYTPLTAGELNVSIKFDKGGKSFWTLLRYKVGLTKPIS